jgi:hypothetical protein
MNESIRVRFTRGGSPLRVSSIDATPSLIFNHEDSALPLEFEIFLEPSVIVQEQLVRIREIEDWQDVDGIPMKTTLDDDDGALVFSGGGTHRPAESLPPGSYTLTFSINETELNNGIQQINIPEGGQAVVTLDQPAPIPFTLVSPDQWDDEIRAFCQNPDARIDGMDPLSWLNQSFQRVARKVCLLNLLATARSLPSARPGESFCPQMGVIRWADVDRIDVMAKPALFDMLQALPAWHDTLPADPVHGAAMARIFGRPADNLDVFSFRQPVVERSMQIVVARDRRTGDTFAEFDIDLGNPDKLPGLIIHTGELIDPGRTDQIQLAPFVRDSAAGDFLYYTLGQAAGV